MSVSPTNTVAPGVESGKPTSVNFRITPVTVSDFTITFHDDVCGTNFTLTKSDFTESNGYLTKSTSYYIYSINVSSKDIYKTVNMSLDDSSSPNILTIEFTNAGPEKLYAWTDSNADPKTVYTSQSTITSGMTLYDNTGTDISLKVNTISGDSFDTQSAYLINFVFGGELTNYSIDETTYTDSATISLTEGNHILTVTTDSIYASISSSYNGLVTSFGSMTGSAKTCTLNVSASGVKVVENDYELGPISSTLTVSGSNAGGSN